MQDVRLPPVYRLVVVDEKTNIAAAAAHHAEQGAEPGTLVCADSETWLRCAVVVRPGENLARARRVLFVAALGLNDALGAVVPAGIDLTLHWPDRIDANAAPVARVALHAPKAGSEASVPDWIVLSADVAVAPESAAPADGFFATTLRGEGCAETTTSDVLASFARHFLTWSNRWQDDGFEPIRAMWLRHAYDYRHRVEIDLAGKRSRGLFCGIDEDGAFELENDGNIARVSLAAAMSRTVTVRRLDETEGG